VAILGNTGLSVQTAIFMIKEIVLPL